jgi:hypothetical protein
MTDLPILFTTPEDDPRIGKHARTHDGLSDGRITSICRLPNGYETFSISYGTAGLTHGGLLLDEIAILDD